MRGIDHLVLPVRDLEDAARLYQRLGFTVGARNRHPWGTENRLVQFPGSFLELITVGEGAEPPPHGPRRFSFGAFIRDYLARREGLAMLVLDSASAGADAASFARAGIGDFEPFFFERRGRRPDGSEVHVAFTLAFARDEKAPSLGFFVSQHHFPENFWNPAFQQHANGATGLGAVAFAAPEPEAHKGFLDAFTGGAPSGGALSWPLTRGRIDALDPDQAAEAYGSVEIHEEPAFVAFSVRVSDLAAQERRLGAEGIAFQRIGSRLVVPASLARGVAIAFEAD